MEYMLDTNTCVFIMNKRPKALDRFYIEQPKGLCLSAVSCAELIWGVSKSVRRAANQVTLNRFLTTVTIMCFDGKAAGYYGSIRHELKGTPIGPNDLFVAAHAMSLGLTLVTNNTREFNRIDNLVLEDWLA